MGMKGTRFGRLTVTWADSFRNAQDEVCWRCHCDCGGEIIAISRELRSGFLRSCGCVPRYRMGSERRERR